jgi:hypothetical protein
MIGQYPYSLNDIENGLLRRNSRSAVPMTSAQFGRDDPRLAFMMDEVDPRIHFALNCGAQSCPPISVYAGEQDKLDKQLDLATKGFLNQSVEFNAQTSTITLSQLFQWYRVDFGKSDDEVLAFVKAKSSAETQKAFAEFEEACKNKTIVYAPYNWAMNT